MDEWVERVSKTERLVIEADLSGLVDEGNTTDEEVLDWRDGSGFCQKDGNNGCGETMIQEEGGTRDDL